MTNTYTSSGVRSALSYCVQQVRTYDYHHYLCLLELPPNMRKSAFAIRAFNVETARAMDVASDPRIGLMRLLWWQEAIDKIFSNKLIEHPVAQALASVVSEHKVSKSWLKRSVEARITDAQREPTDIPETVEELERYACQPSYTQHFKQVVLDLQQQTMLLHILARQVVSRYFLSPCHIMQVGTDIFLIYLLRLQKNMGCWFIRVDDLKFVWIPARGYAMLFLIWLLFPMHICRKPVNLLKQCLVRLIPYCWLLYLRRPSWIH